MLTMPAFTTPAFLIWVNVSCHHRQCTWGTCPRTFHKLVFGPFASLQSSFMSLMNPSTLQRATLSPNYPSSIDEGRILSKHKIQQKLDVTGVWAPAKRGPHPWARWNSNLETLNFDRVRWWKGRCGRGTRPHTAPHPPTHTHPCTHTPKKVPNLT
jgi:hypothetical protein